MKSVKIENTAPTGSAVEEMAPLTSVFDPDSTPKAMEECLENYFNRISAIRVLIGRNEHHRTLSPRQAILAARRYGIPTITRVESSSLKLTKDLLAIYLDLCAETGVKGIQFRSESLHPDVRPREVVSLANSRELDVQFEIEDARFIPSMASEAMDVLIGNATEWLDAGAINLAADMTMVRPDLQIDLNIDLAEYLAGAFGLRTIIFKASFESVHQELFATFGDEVHIGEVPFDRVAAVESMRMNAVTTFAFPSDSSDSYSHWRWSDNRQG